VTLSSCILIIDDEPNLRRTLAFVLQRAGHLVTTAANAKEAVQHLQNGAYDLVFLDLKLPDADGIQFLPVIRRMYPQMPVLILTAHATLESAMEAVRQGARDYLLKPIDPTQIIERVSAVLAEQAQPKRRVEIMSQMHELLGELRHIDSSNQADPANDASSAFADPVRFLRAGPMTLDLYSQNMIIGEKTVSIPPSTFDYLVTLVRHSPNPVQYETLVAEAQGYTVTRAEAREMAR
jgi:DNA-binding response OmpR family regulator